MSETDIIVPMQIGWCRSIIQTLNIYKYMLTLYHLCAGLLTFSFKDLQVGKQFYFLKRTETDIVPMQ